MTSSEFDAVPADLWSRSGVEVKTLREPQRRGFLRVFSRIVGDLMDEVVLSGPTGLGKTLILSALLATLTRQRRRPFRCALVVAPTKEILDNFLDQGIVRFGAVREEIEGDDPNDVALVTLPPVDLNQAVGRKAREADAVVNDTEELLSYLRCEPGRGAVKMATMSRLVQALKLAEERNEELDLRGVAIGFDEIHHVPVREGSEETDPEADWSWAWARQRCVALGATSIGASATAYRADGQPVCTEECLANGFVEIGRGELIEAALCPRRINIEVVTLPYAVSDPSRLMEREVSKEARTAEILLMFEKWVEHGCPKAIFRFVDHVNHHESVEEAWRRLLATEGDRIRRILGRDPHEPLRVWGPKDLSDEDRERLRHDRKAKAWDALKIDVIFGCRKVQEGFDYPPCSHLYNLGIPSSPVLQEQLVGRTARLKDDLAGYLEAFKDVSSMFICVPSVDETASEKILASKKTRDMLLITVAFMASTKRGQDFLPLDVLLRRSLARFSRTARDLMEGDEIAGGLVLGARLRAEAELEIRKAMSRLEARLGREPTARELLQDVGARLKRAKKGRLLRAVGILLMEMMPDIEGIIEDGVAPPPKTPSSGNAPPRLPEVLEVLRNALDRIDAHAPDLIAVRDTFDANLGAVVMSADGPALTQVKHALLNDGHIDEDRERFLERHDFASVLRVVERRSARKGGGVPREADLSRDFGLVEGAVTYAWLDRAIGGRRLRGTPDEVSSMADLETYRLGYR